MRAGRIIMVIVGAVLAVAGFTAVVGGSVLVAMHVAARDGAGYYQAASERIDTSTAALVGQLDLGAGAADWIPDQPLGTVRVRATAVNGGALFLGVAPAADVDRWLAGTSYTRVDDVAIGNARTEVVAGGSAGPPAPIGQLFWAASVTGPGTQTLVWPSERGEWAVVLMNADATPGVAADVSVGAKTGAVLVVGIVLGGVGLVVLAAGLVIMLAALAGTRPTAPPATPAPAGTYPVRLDGRLDPNLSRWRWLVKWLLALPHAIVLAFLWFAFVPLTIVAGFAILFTGRYPRSIFEFNAGVMRWTWRVIYYAFSALGTDRYPPFSLGADPSYPADFTVDYPQRLSRGLVLVKWWLLAIPHYVVVAFFAGGWTVGSRYGDDARIAAGGGLIGVLVLVAAVVLLFTGRYPRPVFDFVMGMNRWCYRVLAYAALMRDEYPPFRLDNGGTDPGSVLPPVPPVPDRGGELVGTATR